MLMRQLRLAVPAFTTLFAYGCVADDAQTQIAEELASPPATQFLTLPDHPHTPGDSEDGEMEEGEGSHFIWRAPLENGLPPGQSSGEQPEPAAPSPLAPRSDVAVGAVAELRVSSDGAPYHGETGAAAANGVIVGGSNRIFPGACGSNPCGVEAYESLDGGATWTTSAPPMTWGGTTFGITFDPALDYDKNGTFYYAFGGAPLGGSYPNSIAVSKRTAANAWSTPSAVTFNKRRAFDDKYWLAIDRSSTAFANSIYVTWDRNLGNNQILYVSTSSNGGATWTAPVKVNDGTSKFERVIGAYPAVDHATGTVYDSWHDYAKDIIFVDRSTSGGASWGTDVAAATTHTGFGADIGCNGGREQGPAHHLKVGPSGTLHLVYADSVAGRGFDILYTRSTNGGATWSTPVRLDDDTGAAHQFHPTLSVSAGAGGDVVSVTFYDRRDDAANCLTHVYSTRSFDGGASWSANVRLTSTASNFDGNSNGPGDYSSSTPDGSGDRAFFSGHPAGSNYEIFSALAQ